MTQIRRMAVPGSARDRHRDVLAQRYVMGLLAPSSRRAFMAWMSQDARLQALVRQWEHALAQLSMHVPHMAPSPALWRRIQAQLPPPRRPAPAKPVHWWTLLWRAASLRMAGAALAGALGAAVLIPQWGGPDEEGAVPASYVGVLTDAADQPALVVASLRHARLVQVKLLRPIDHPAALQPVLWALAPGEAPRAVARLPDRGKANLSIALPADRAFERVTRLAVSLEPIGSPGSALPLRPSGSYVVSGHCAKVW